VEHYQPWQNPEPNGQGSALVVGLTAGLPFWRSESRVCGHTASAVSTARVGI